MEVLFGVHPVTEAVRSRARDVDHVTLQAGGNPRLAALADLCRANRVRVTQGSRDELSRMTKTEQHGGVVAFLKERKLLALEDLFTRQNGAAHMLLALDGVEDPHNLGALLRSADGAGATGVVLPERRAVGVTGTVAKAAAGATEHVRIAQVTNLVRSLEALKKENVWIVGLDERGTQDYTDFDFRGDFCLVLGREGAGLHDLSRKTCDFLLRIPMAGAVPSLNVSVAGAVVLYEAARQRRVAARPAVAGNEVAAKASKPRKGLGS
ncbi:23S rRNA (guanosine(2251)-2'-O)-methyltransferase RlmB [Terriglobus aquaticus]|uniref:23S rRNA (Guanosine(2251)-2'-O)-methyltransferase RlmB n=1 Tax=Terriglobus aquaticus TaxID=940139 RepID=A0ABW9KN92_9BACT|nr:23S rRNA (guanosine(2251)-2'-O)-methyltransferase RlmB [Terriglobus aquaticus]